MKSSKVISSCTLFSDKRPFKCSKVMFRKLVFSALLSFILTRIYLFNPATQHASKCDTINLPGSFAKLMQSFPWQQYRNAVNANDISTTRKYTEQLLTTILIPFTIKEPVAQVNLFCHAPPLWEPERIGNCTRLKLSRKVGAILNFGFDVDALELHLHELDSIVDKFFLMEGTKIHNRYLNTKPSIWDMIKYSPRFSQFRDKIVHFIMDDAAYADTEIYKNSGTILPKLYDRENLQKKIRLEKFLEWNKATNYFGPHDVIGIGDTDEIPNRNVVNFLKLCEIQNENVQIGIWFPFPYIHTILASDYPVSGHPFTFAAPYYSTVNDLTNSLTKPYEWTGISQNSSLLGGIHFSKYLYIPFQLTKDVTNAEAELKGLEAVIDIGLLYKSVGHGYDESVEKLVIETWMKKWEGYIKRIKSVDAFRLMFGDNEANAIIRIPWFYECNPNRFPSFHGIRDLRIV